MTIEEARQVAKRRGKPLRHVLRDMAFAADRQNTVNSGHPLQAEKHRLQSEKLRFWLMRLKQPW